MTTVPKSDILLIRRDELVAGVARGIASLSELGEAEAIESLVVRIVL
jgi:hypothetical protein